MRQYLSLLTLFSFITLFFFIYNPKEYQQAEPIIECLFLPEKIESVCALCLQSIPKNRIVSKGYIVHSSEEFALLTVAKKVTLLTCKDFLQFASYDSLAPQQRSIALQQTPPFDQLQVQLSSHFTPSFKNPTHSLLVQPTIPRFIIYQTKLLNNLPPSTTILYSSLSNLQSLHQSLIYLVVVQCILITSIILSRSGHKENPIPFMNIVMSFCVIALAMLYYTDDVANNVELRWLMQLAKTALIALVYVRIKINYIKTGFVVAIGTIALLSPNLFVVYLLATWLGMFFTIHQLPQFKAIFRYLLCTLLLLFFNQLIWVNLLQLKADTLCRLIQSFILLITPLSILLIKDKKVHNFKQYIPYDPQKGSLSPNSQPNIES